MTRVRTTAPPVKSRTTGDSTPARPFTAARSVTSTAARPRWWLRRPDAVPLSTDTPTVLWTLRTGHRRRECSVQLLPHGLDLHLALNGDTPYCSRTFHTQDELLAWAEEAVLRSR